MLDCPKITQNVPRQGNRFSVWLGNSVLRLLGWRFEGKWCDSKKAVIAVAPHTSNWDFLISIAVVFCLRLKISFFGKKSIFIPPFSWFLQSWGGIPIDRRQKHGVVAQIITEIDSRDSMLLCLAPEGTRSPAFPWKTGFLHIAHQADIPVFMIGLDYKRKVICLGPAFIPSENIQLEIQKVYTFYAKVHPKFPHKVAFPAETKV